jgi:beta-glucuronidase
MMERRNPKNHTDHHQHIQYPPLAKTLAIRDSSSTMADQSFSYLYPLKLALLLVILFATSCHGTRPEKNLRQAPSSQSLHRRTSPNYWPKYSGKNRQVYLLDGVWNTSQLTCQHSLQTFDSMDPDLDIARIATPDLMHVPSTVDATPPGYLGYRGVTFYRTEITNDDNDMATARIQFQACSFYCRVWLNGVEIGHHLAGGYVSWWLDVPSDVLSERGKKQQQRTKDASTHELFVLADNRWNATTAPMHTGGDFWHYGGILRSVEWHVFPNHDSAQDSQVLWPWRLYVFPQRDMQSVRLSMQLVQMDHEGAVHNVRVAFDSDDDGSIHKDNSLLLSGHTNTADYGLVDLGVVQVPSPRVWTTHDPQLHTISLKLNDAIVTERFGLRYFDTAEVPLADGTAVSRIRLNGSVLKLVGWNHHTQWPITGASPTDDQLDADMTLLKEKGHVNFVRGAHYPQDPRWLDRLDEAGIVMWSETLGPRTSVENMQDPYFLKYQHQQINEMLDNAMNHASIAFWAFFNEGPSHKKKACPGYKASSDAIKRRDTTRFITYASNEYPAPDQCHDAATVIAYNGYPGWYADDTPAAWWNRTATAVSATKKPFLISETGAAGIYEWRQNETAVKWTLEYQTQIITQDVDLAISDPRISGICLWHFFDFKVDDKWENNTHCDYLPGVNPPTCGYIQVDKDARGRPGGANHKGVVDFYRRPKPVFPIIAAKYANVTDVVDVSKGAGAVHTIFY